MTWPEIPENLNELSAADLRKLANEIHQVRVSQLARTDLSAADLDEIATYAAKRADIRALAETKERQARLAAEAAEETEDDVETEDTTASTTEDETTTEDAEDKELALAGAKGGKAATTFGSTAPVKPVKPGKPLSADQLVRGESGPGGKTGDAFASWAEVAQAAVAKAQSIRGNTPERFDIAHVRGNFSEDRRLGDNVISNLAKFDQSELTAAFCAPATPHYNLHCANATRRPVFTSLPGFEAPRGQVAVMSSPALSDITSGYGIWTDTDDDSATKTKACATVACGTPTTYKMYGVWRCLTVKNLMAMTYPELVEAYLNRLAAAQARLADQTLLQAMYSGVVDIDAPRLGYGGTTTILSTILNYLALYQETQRWDITDNMEAWAPRWVLWGIKMDLLRRRQTNSDVPRVATDSEIATMFSNVGINIHWFMDTPSWAVAIPAVGNSVLNLIPQSVQILIAPPGKFALIDRGNVSIGVTGNNIYRDTTSNARNQFTFFFESFEGIVNTTSCPAHVLDIPVCWNGAQIDDIVINCQGGDEAGYQS